MALYTVQFTPSWTRSEANFARRGRKPRGRLASGRRELRGACAVEAWNSLVQDFGIHGLRAVEQLRRDLGDKGAARYTVTVLTASGSRPGKPSHEAYLGCCCPSARVHQTDPPAPTSQSDGWARQRRSSADIVVSHGSHFEYVVAHRVNYEVTIMNAGNPNGLAISSADPSGMGKMFLDVEAAAQRLDVTVGWIYERTRRNLIPHRKLGRFVRFTEEDLQKISEAAARGELR
jgi:excisionase family DNA binding protein